MLFPPRGFAAFLFLLFVSFALLVPGGELFLEGFAEAFHADVLAGAHLDGLGVVLAEFRAAGFVADFGLVEYADTRRLGTDDAFECLVSDFQMLPVVGGGTVNNFQDAVRMSGHAERTLEGFD